MNTKLIILGMLTSFSAYSAPMPTCENSLAPFFNDKITKMCLLLKDTPTSYSTETINCLKQSKRSMSENFLTVLTEEKAADFMRGLALDCSTPSRSYHNARLKFKGSHFFATGEMSGQYNMGGLSDLAYDDREKVLLAGSDQRRLGENLIFKFDIDILESGVTVKLLPDIIHLRAQYKKKYFDFDFEGMAKLPDGSILTSSESLFSSDKGYLRLFSADGNQIRGIEVPKKFYNNLQLNKIFESLTATRDASHIFTSTEAPLITDIGSEGSFVRIVKMNSDFVSQEEYLYKLDGDHDFGLSEMLAIDENNLLMLERSWDPKTGKNNERIYEVSLKGASNVFGMRSLKNPNTLAIRKQLVIDLDEILSSLPAGLRRLDNLEGMAWGPLSEAGHPTLVLVSDNNINPKQFTEFLVFEYLK